MAERGTYLRIKFGTPLTPGVTISKIILYGHLNLDALPNNAGK